MKNLMSAFIDSYEDLTLLLEKKGKYKGKSFYLYNSSKNVTYFTTDFKSHLISFINLMYVRSLYERFDYKRVLVK